jgi:hypothetical protein
VVNSFPVFQPKYVENHNNETLFETIKRSVCSIETATAGTRTTGVIPLRAVGIIPDATFTFENGILLQWTLGES